MKHLTVIQHTQSEWLGAIEDHLEGRGIRFSYIRPFTAGARLPDVTMVGDGLVMLGGGPWGASSPDHLLPTLDAEVRLARACLMLGKPVLGLGLGCQILALAADGGADPAPFRFIVGMARRVKAHALGGFLPDGFASIVYGRDRAVPPPYAEILAVDEEGHPAAFQVGPNAFGFAGHLGLRPAMIEDLIMEFDEAPDGCGETLPLLRASANAIEDALVPIMTGIVALTGWMQA